MSLRWLIALVLLLALIVFGGVALLIADQGELPEDCINPPTCNVHDGQ